MESANLNNLKEDFLISDTNKVQGKYNVDSIKEEQNEKEYSLKKQNSLGESNFNTENEKKNSKKILPMSKELNCNEMHKPIQNITDKVENMPYSKNDNEKISENIENTVKNKKFNDQNPRKFKESPDGLKYYKGFVFTQPESGGTVFDRCLEFKSFFICVLKAPDLVLEKFVRDIIKFACGCINNRVNGTICFGVADSAVPKNDYENYFHGEIVGFRIDETGLNCKYKYTDALRKGIKKCFDSSNASNADRCISDPKFIEVVVPGDTNYYVMEVDVEPISTFCKGNCFYVDLNIIEKPNIKIDKREWKIYVRDGSATASIQKKDEANFVNNKIPKLDQQKNELELQKKLEQAIEIFKNIDEDMLKKVLELFEQMKQ